ncbi:MAG TPA: surface lipoprotein assembly modifier [Terriglobia bacterium]|nr:surface lipoprotein assembly modifier [Terriglobia bacterium]
MVIDCPCKRRGWYPPSLRRVALGCAAALLVTTLATPGEAQSRTGLNRWSARGAAGVQFDNNVTTAETDTTSNQGDHAAVFELGAAYRPSLGDPAKLELGYDFSQSLYANLDEFDLQSHTFSAAVEHEAGGIDFGLNYLLGRSSFGREAFLSLHSITPTAGISVSDAWYANVRYSAVSKHFLRGADEPRDGWNHSLTLDNFIFFQNNRSYVSAGYKIENENTNGPQFNYLGHVFWGRLKYALPIERLARLNPTLQTGGLYYTRHYDNVTPSIAEKREDKRKEFTASLTADIVDPLYAVFSYEYIDAISNLPTADYVEQIVTLRLGFRF